MSFVLGARRKRGREECGREAADGTAAGRTLRGTTRMGGEEHEMRCNGTITWAKWTLAAAVVAAGVSFGESAWGAEKDDGTTRRQDNLHEELVEKSASDEEAGMEGGQRPVASLCSPSEKVGRPAERPQAESTGRWGDGALRTEIGAHLVELIEEEAQLRRDSIEDANPVLVAYEQLSREMQVWFALFAALGTFLGILVPVIAYWLQIKAVDRHEAQMKNEIQKAMEEVKREVPELIDTKVSSAEREMGETMQATVQEVASKFPDLWKQHAIYVKMLINELYDKVINEWQHNRDGAEIGLGLVSFCNWLDNCAFSSEDPDELQDAADLVLRVWGGLQDNENAPKWWRDFSTKIAAKNKRVEYEFHFTKALLGNDRFALWNGYCEELGIKNKGGKS